MKRFSIRIDFYSLLMVLGLSLIGGLLTSYLSRAQCGGDERWAVKVGADADAGQVKIQDPVSTTIDALVHLSRPTLPSDEITRLSEELTVRIVEGRIVEFALQSGKKGDSDFHLVISDETLLYTHSGSGSILSPHSVIAEIPDPNCISGRKNTVTGPSIFQTQLANVRAKFTQKFPNIKSGWNDAQGIAVKLTGVTFFDKQHGQIGRALNGVEPHPLLDIEFLNESAPPPTPPLNIALIQNGSFEDGQNGWTSTSEVITTDPKEPAHSGSGKAWLGGYGESHTDKLWQQVSLPSSSTSIALTVRHFMEHFDDIFKLAPIEDRKALIRLVIQEAIVDRDKKVVRFYLRRIPPLTPTLEKLLKKEKEPADVVSSSSSGGRNFPQLTPLIQEFVYTL